MDTFTVSELIAWMDYNTLADMRKCVMSNYGYSAEIDRVARRFLDMIEERMLTLNDIIQT